MGFEFGKNQPYVMPAHFGPSNERWDGKVAHYEDNTALTVMYVTDHKAVSAILPPGFEATDPAIMTVNFVMCRGVDYLAGGGYNLLSFDISTRFEGKRDRAEGDFSLVVWENKFMPVVLGREVLGMPKLMADIPDAWTRDGKRGFSVSENGTLLFEGELSDLQKIPDEALGPLVAQRESKARMGWKYIPSCDMRGADVSNVTMLPTKDTFKEVWMGQGKLMIHNVTWERAPLSSRIVNILRELPVLEYKGGFMSRFSHDLLIDKQYPMK